MLTKRLMVRKGLVDGSLRHCSVKMFVHLDHVLSFACSAIMGQKVTVGR